MMLAVFGAARGRDEVGRGDEVLGAGALGGAVDDGVYAVQRGVNAVATEQVALRPVHAGVADMGFTAQCTDAVSGLGRFADHPVPECAGRAGDEELHEPSEREPTRRQRKRAPALCAGAR